MSSTTRGMPSAAHLVLGAGGIGQAGEDLAAEADPFDIIANAAVEEGCGIVSHPDSLDGDPPVELSIGGFLVELELHRHLILRATFDTDAVDANSGKDRVAVLNPAAVEAIVAAQIVAILGVTVGCVVGKDVGCG